MSVPKFRTAYDGRNAEVSDETGISFEGDPGLAQQQFSAECDINNIMARYEATGLVRVSSNYARGEYLNLAAAPDFHEAMNIVLRAEESFSQLPASLRKRFDNDPAKFLEFVHDDKNEEEMRSLGLLEPKPEPKGPVEVRVINPATPPAASAAEGA